MILELSYHQTGKDVLINAEHIHENCYEIIQTFSNDGNLLIDKSIYPITPGAIYTINAESVHCSAPKNIKTYERNKLILNKNLLHQFTEAIGCKKTITNLFESPCSMLILPQKLQLEIDKLFYDIYTMNNTTKTNVMNIYSKVLNMLSICTDNTYNHQTPTKNIKQYIYDSFAYIDQNLSTFCLADLCSYLHLDKSYLCRQFKIQSGMTIMEYVKFQRISLAKQKLINTTRSISDIVDELGFSSTSYFCSLFKSIERMSPTAYRKKYNK